ncbi:MAG: hypothetical protein J1E60_06145 [Christensenellaceae bacterium]|nr:hypothetical protein [Christensenellaceae bacterium]
MALQKIFLITPLGERNTPDRRHADKMWNDVFKPLSEKPRAEKASFEFVRSDLLKESGQSRVQEIMNLIHESTGCIVDLYKIENLNVMYEIGLAHSQGKRVFFLRSDKISESDIPSDIRFYADYYHPYNLDIFNGDASSDEVNNITKRVSEVVDAMLTDINSYRPSFYKPTELYVSNILEDINGKITNLEKLLKDFGTSSEDERTLAQYIIGENEAFRALTAAVQKSNISVKTTRFSPYSVVGRQNDFFNTINDLMSRSIHPESFERIIAANNIEKFNEVVKLMVNNAGKNFKIYISKIEYSFEMVIVDDQVVFIHFRKYNNVTTDEKPQDQPVSLISATLKIDKRLIANEFSTIFDSITDNSKDIACVIDCNQISTETLSEEINKYRHIFYAAVNEYEGAANPTV